MTPKAWISAAASLFDSRPAPLLVSISSSSPFSASSAVVHSSSVAGGGEPTASMEGKTKASRGLRFCRGDEGTLRGEERGERGLRRGLLGEEEENAGGVPLAAGEALLTARLRREVP